MKINLINESIKIINPNTLDDIEKYLLIAGISLGLFIFTMILLKKYKNKHKGMM